jgi:GalNAc-alpha-(1->4)-GalNAc-alpha-(1->3)-diNAcBac-PP-undecaprenol alpha-1,4-N-acetyl-D-galactosaminyltransferase
MRVLFLTSSLEAGGAERVAATLCNAWAGSGHSVGIVPTYSGGGVPFYTLDPDVRIQYLSDLVGVRKKSAFTYFKRLAALRTLVAETKADVVVSFLPNVNVAAILATALLAVPVVISERRDPSSQPASRLWELACRLLYRFADAVVAQTECVRGNIGTIYPGLRRVVCIPNPLPAELLERQPHVDPGPRRILLSLGRLAPEKQIDHVVRCFARLALECPYWELHIYGDGPARADLEELAIRLGASARVFFKGRTSDPWGAMEIADAFVMTSRFEGFPNALLEAMGMGLPCVTYDCPSGPCDISRGGEDALLVPLNDEQQLYAQLRQLLTSTELRQRLGRKARNSVVERYQLNVVLKQWDALFDELGVTR